MTRGGSSTPRWSPPSWRGAQSSRRCCARWERPSCPRSSRRPHEITDLPVRWRRRLTATFRSRVLGGRERRVGPSRTGRPRRQRPWAGAGELRRGLASATRAAFASGARGRRRRRERGTGIGPTHADRAAAADGDAHNSTHTYNDANTAASANAKAHSAASADADTAAGTDANAAARTDAETHTAASADAHAAAAAGADADARPDTNAESQPAAATSPAAGSDPALVASGDPEISPHPRPPPRKRGREESPVSDRRRASASRRGHRNRGDGASLLPRWRGAALRWHAGS